MNTYNILTFKRGRDKRKRRRRSPVQASAKTVNRLKDRASGKKFLRDYAVAGGLMTLGTAGIVAVPSLIYKNKLNKVIQKAEQDRGVDHQKNKTQVIRPNSYYDQKSKRARYLGSFLRFQPRSITFSQRP